jgi:hypothetical protein
MRSWKTITAVTLGVTAVGLIAGASIAAPDQMVPLMKWVGRSMVNDALPAAERLAATVQQSAAHAVQDRSPRTLAMLAAGAATVLLGAAALFMSLRGRRRPPVARTPAVNAAFQGAPRRPLGRSTPKQVRALAEQGSSPADIARRTGLPMDAITLLLAVSNPARQLPPTSARIAG